MELMPHQKKAIRELSNGKILHGQVGTGKSATLLGYYIENEAPKDIYVITTAKKRDNHDWINEAAHFAIVPWERSSWAGKITVDSWNNISNYTDVENAFFVFDEQRVVGNGVWVKSFLKIAKKNNWLLLSGTPGDTWLDYIPVFVANGFYKDAYDFKYRHVVYEPYLKFPKIRMYLNETKLEMLRNHILVEMPYVKHTQPVLNWTDVSYDRDLFKRIQVDRWNPYDEKPIKDVSEMYRLMRRAVNSDPSRLEMIETLMKAHKKLIIFYNFNYELEILRLLGGSFYNTGEYAVAEWNGHKKEPIPDTDSWIYLVQYVAGAEGWNCIETDAMIFYSLTYSYRNFEQAQGRIDRLNTPFIKLYYYALLTDSFIDRGIKDSLERKEDFNERKFTAAMFELDDNSEDFEMKI